MGKSLAGDCGRLTLLCGRWATALFYIARLPIGASALQEVRHAC
jgi:hypothetical protein